MSVHSASTPSSNDSDALASLFGDMSADDWRALRERRLSELLSLLVERNPFYRDKLIAAGLVAAENPRWTRGSIRITELPFTTKAELVADQQRHPPYGSNRSRPVADFVRLHQTSGSTGQPLRWLDTAESWRGLLDNWRHLFPIMGVQPSDRFLFAFSFGPFLGFWAGFEGACQLGNFCLAGGGLSSEARLKAIYDHSITVLCCTPSYALRLAEVAREQGLALSQSPVKMVLVAGEPGGSIPSTRARISEAWGARVVDHWGMTELGPLAIEPLAAPGELLLLETACWGEVVDPATGQPVAPGDEGELVITNFGRADSPLLRYRTGDRVRAATSTPPSPGPLAETADARPAPDGKTDVRRFFLRLQGGILGRLDDMITLRGNNLYPSALEELIRELPHVAEYRIEVRTVRAMQELALRVEFEPHVSDIDATASLQMLGQQIRLKWNVSAQLERVPPGSLPRFELKAKRFVRIEETP